MIQSLSSGGPLSWHGHVFFTSLIRLFDDSNRLFLRHAATVEAFVSAPNMRGDACRQPLQSLRKRADEEDDSLGKSLTLTERSAILWVGFKIRGWTINNDHTNNNNRGIPTPTFSETCLHGICIYIPHV